MQPAALFLYKGQQTFSCKKAVVRCTIKEAIGSVLNDGLSQKQAADLHGVPHSTLRIGLVVELFMALILVLGHTCLQKNRNWQDAAKMGYAPPYLLDGEVKA